MATLWMKFPDEVLLSHEFTLQTREKLEKIFSNSNEKSVWRKALDHLGMQAPPADMKMIRWAKDKPYFNWSAYTDIISGGSVTLAQGEGVPYVQVFSYKPKHVMAMLKLQWKVTRFLNNPQHYKDKLLESIVLGLALQSLIFRLGPDHVKMADWLASPEQAPGKYRETIKQIQSIQVRRTAISDVWREHFGLSFVPDEAVDDLPEYHWDDREVVLGDDKEGCVPAQSSASWSGKPVCAGLTIGVGVAADKSFDPEKIKAIKVEESAPIILVFRDARPETTELFEHADAVLFCNGGVLSHACTVARERGIPSVTDLGTNFFDCVKGLGQCWLRVDAGEATVKFVGDK